MRSAKRGVKPQQQILRVKAQAVPSRRARSAHSLRMTAPGGYGRRGRMTRKESIVSIRRASEPVILSAAGAKDLLLEYRSPPEPLRVLARGHQLSQRPLDVRAVLRVRHTEPAAVGAQQPHSRVAPADRVPDPVRD